MSAWAWERASVCNKFLHWTNTGLGGTCSHLDLLLIATLRQVYATSMHTFEPGGNIRSLRLIHSPSHAWALQTGDPKGPDQDHSPKNDILWRRLACYSQLSHFGTPWAVLPIELFHGMTFGCSWAAGTVNCSRISPPGLKSTTQVQTPPVSISLTTVCCYHQQQP